MHFLEQKLALLKRKGDTDWLTGNDFWDFVDTCDTREDVLLYYAEPCNPRDSIYMTSLLVKDDKKDSFGTPPSWVFENGWDWYTRFDGKDCSKVIPKELGDFEPIYFVRHFDGRTETEGKNYIDVYQKVLHILDLHFVPHKNAYCLYDELGDLIEVIKYERTSKYESLIIKRKFLNIYLQACGLTLVRFFDCTRLGSNGIVRWETKEFNKNNMKGTIGKAEDSLFINVIQVVIKEILKKQEPQYAEFKIYDLKNNKEIMYSCDPKGYCSYFNWTENDLPHNLSPAFFKSEVLNKYRDNPDKYTLSERHIDCRGWGLKSYDINSDGLVHVYMVDMSKLPYEEQLYWKSYNVDVPFSGRLGGISERAWLTDFEGRFPEKESLHQRIIRTVDKLRQNPFWNVDEKSPINATIDENSKTWANSIAAVYNVFIHRIQVNKLKQLLIKEYYEKESDLKQQGSIGLLKKLFGHKGLDVKSLEVFDEVRVIRNACDSHLNQAEKNKLVDTVKTKYSSFQQHYTNLLTRMLETIDCLLEILPQAETQ